ncbi:MAG: 16S rRNA (guanine(527)-N(7))-methyltransferase RsmG [Culicoidibacterales bacterium]
MENRFIQQLAAHKIELSARQIEQFELYFEMLVEWNQKLNLTAITQKDAVYKKHFYDSLTPAFTFDFNKIESLCDVGSGAGFPSFVLKIVYPHLEITIVEALEKRIKFLEAVVEALELDNIKLVHERAEQYGRLHRQKFDVVTARAVARLPLLSELCIPLIRKGGYFIVLKGEQGATELVEAKNALEVLGITNIKTEELFLEATEDKRTLFFMKKGLDTPIKYPRNFGQIKQKPL